jgi:hypothetical protein
MQPYEIKPGLPLAASPDGCRVVSLQMGALRAGLDGTPLVLIQGPPGTGVDTWLSRKHAWIIAYAIC